MRRILLATAVAGAALFSAPADASACYATVCALATECHGTVNVCPGANPSDCDGSVDVCPGLQFACGPLLQPVCALIP